MFNLGDICSIDNDNNDKTDNMSNDYAEMSTSTRKMQSSIQHPSGTISRSNTTVGMAQKDLMRVLIRTDGKGMISDYKGNEKVKLTKLLEVIPKRKPEQAKIGEVVRFMYYPGNGTSAY